MKFQNIICVGVVFLISKVLRPCEAQHNFVLITHHPCSWEEAKMACENQGGHLAVLDTTAKANEAHNLITHGSQNWIGLSYEKDTGQGFTWADGTSARLSNNQYTGPKTPKTSPRTCYYLSYDGKFKHKQACHAMAGYICENLDIGSTVSGSSTVVPSTPSLQPSTSSALYSETSRSSMSMMSSIVVMATTTDLTPEIIQPSTSHVVAKATETLANRSVITLIKEFSQETILLDAADLDSLQHLVRNFDNLIESVHKFDSEDAGHKGPYLMPAANAMEIFTMRYAKIHLNSSKERIHTRNTKIDMEMVLVAEDLTKTDLVFLSDKDHEEDQQIIFPPSLFKNKGKTVVVNMFFNVTLAPPHSKHESERNVLVNTKIISSSISPRDDQVFEDPVKIRFRHLKDAKGNPEVTCRFWNFSLPGQGDWSDSGCHVVTSSSTHTTCACNHLTNFAVLMRLSPTRLAREHQVALDAISYVGLLLSLLGEVVTVVTYLVFLNVHNEKTQIRLNLICNLALAQIVLLAGINATDHKPVCVMVAAMIQYTYITSFCWMLMEGAYLYRVVVKVFDSDIIIRYCYIFSYGFPALVVSGALLLARLLTGGLYTYLNPRFCWVASHNYLIWTFAGPVVLIASMNFLILVCVIREMVRMPSVKCIKSISVSNLRSSVRACVILLPLLGITWLFGLLSIGRTGVAGHYIFTVLNSTQGFMIFIFHCLRNTELKAAFRLKVYQWESSNRDGARSPSGDARKKAGKDARSQEMHAINKVTPSVT